MLSYSPLAPKIWTGLNINWQYILSTYVSIRVFSPLASESSSELLFSLRRSDIFIANRVFSSYPILTGDVTPSSSFPFPLSPWLPQFLTAYNYHLNITYCNHKLFQVLCLQACSVKCILASPFCIPANMYQVCKVNHKNLLNS